MIPKIIHICWLSGDAFPEGIIKCLKSWSENLQGYEIWLWGKLPHDISCFGGLNVVEKFFDLDSVPWTKEAFKAKKYAFAADYIRLYALYNFGGIYLDADVVVYKSFDELLSLPYFIGCDQIRAFEAAVIGAEPECQWIKDVLDTYFGKHFVKLDGSYDQMELPVRFHHELVKAGYHFRRVIGIKELKNLQTNMGHTGSMKRLLYVFDKDFFNSRDAVEVRRTSKSFCAHNYAGSWQSPNKGKKSLKDRLPKWMLKIIFTVGQATWAKNKYAWFQIPFEK